jgi:hypothetical protein
MTVLNVAEFAKKLAQPITSGSLIQRIPFTLTSTARLIRSGKTAVLSNAAAALSTATVVTNRLLSIEEQTRPISASYRAVTSAANTAAVLSGISPQISMAINPQDIKWKQTKRYTKRDTMGGSVFFHFTNSADQNNDILVMDFSGKTGNINTNVGTMDVLSTGANAKLKLFHELYHLTREGMLLNSANTGSEDHNGKRNEFMITYKTILIPMPLTLIGFFNSALEFSETAADPFNRAWSFSFTVTDTSPSLDDLNNRLSLSLVSRMSKNLINEGITAAVNVAAGAP